MGARELRRVSVDEYVALDRSSEGRWEYVNGEAFAMAGASARHNAIVMNISLALGTALRGTACFALGSDQKIATIATRSFHYPDVSIVCGKPRYAKDDEHAISNPKVLFEVLSESTSDYDRGAKLDHYATVPELEEYVVVFSATKRVEHRKRTGADQWLVTDVLGGELRLASVGVTLAFDDIYRDLERVEP